MRYTAQPTMGARLIGKFERGRGDLLLGGHIDSARFGRRRREGLHHIGIGEEVRPASISARADRNPAIALQELWRDVFTQWFP
ncbi:hypothetical protein, partial [Streptomyces sp. Agncl-13]|uniref:hypothetical protein n=1 Tax=Streptomyces sp. Agncl-13 TaxID=3400628 RepID=UPI003A8AB878